MPECNGDARRTTTAEKWIPVWSHQHGAYISVITSWLIGTVASDSPAWSQAVVLVFLLSAFQWTELLQEAMKKRFRIVPRKKLWLVLYAATALGTAVWLFRETMNFALLFPCIVGVGAIFLLLSLRRLHKGIVAELLAFSALAFGGLLAYNPSSHPGRDLVELWILLSAYFGVSVFTVKVRFEKIGLLPLVAYLAAAVATVWVTVDWHGGIPFLFALMVARLVPALMAGDWYRSLKIRTIGFMELGYCLALVMIFVMGF